MKKVIMLLILVLNITHFFAQSKVKNDILNDNVQKKQETKNFAYQLYATQNIWTFIKLNTRNSQMWQVEFGLEGKNRFETILNSISLVTNDQETNGRFTLYSTQNIWNFILLDQIDGKTWQVQWSKEVESRAVIPIE